MNEILNILLLLLLSSFTTRKNVVQCFVITTPTTTSVRNIPFLKNDNIVRSSSTNIRINNHPQRYSTTTSDNDDDTQNIESQVISTGYSNNNKLINAIKEATIKALDGLPPTTTKKIDLAMVSLSSLYDNNPSMSLKLVVPTLIEFLLENYDTSVENIIGCTSGGIVSSMLNPAAIDKTEEGEEDGSGVECTANSNKHSLSIETEGLPGVSVTLCMLPDVEISTFHVMADNVPDETVGPNTFMEELGLGKFQTKLKENDPYLMLFPSPSFSNTEEISSGFKNVYPNSNSFGAIASTVSSLSRARLFRYSKSEQDGNDDDSKHTFTDGCVGVALQGDILIHSFVCQGAKPVGDVYKIVDGEASTIRTIMLDEASSSSSKKKKTNDTNAKSAAAYDKARIPKPPLAEANILMKRLSDDEQAFMRTALLVGIDTNTTPNKKETEHKNTDLLSELKEGKGNKFTVRQVTSAGGKDGSVTFPLKSVHIKNNGQRMGFYVRESDFAKQEVTSTWTGYKSLFLKDFTPTACFLYPTLDRGIQLFSGSTSNNPYESNVVRSFLPDIESVAGFFSNGVLGTLNGIFSKKDIDTDEHSIVHASASAYILFGSKTKRPIYSAIKTKSRTKPDGTKEINPSKESTSTTTSDTDNNQEQTDNNINNEEEQIKTAPRDPLTNEIIIKRREFKSGRAISVSNMEWSVADKKVYPTSTLEGYIWDKEFEVDKFRERVPLSNLVSQCNNIENFFPEFKETNDWIASFHTDDGEKDFIIIPECKRSEPLSGSLRKRYNVEKLVKQYISSGAKSISINTDQALFGGSIDDIKVAKTTTISSNNSKIPILASDLILYPYQLYKLRLSGADAIYFVVAALTDKDIFYLTKITKSLKMQTVLSVTTPAQIQILTNSKQLQGSKSIDCLVLSNRDLETFAIDETGNQVLELANCNELKEFRETFGYDIPILAEGKIGLIDNVSASTLSGDNQYIQKLKQTGIFSGAIVASALVSATNSDDDDDSSTSDGEDATGATLNFIL